MEINVKRIGEYRDVNVTLDNTKVALGMLDCTERRTLAKTLKKAIGDLLEDYEYLELMNDEELS